MLKRVAVCLSLTLLAASTCLAQANPRGEAKLELNGKTITVDYGRPSLKGRDMLGKATVGQSWRMGADGATTLKTAAELSFGATVVPQGDYTLTAKKTGETDWQLEIHGAEGEVIATVPFESGKLEESVEEFTIVLKEGEEGGGKLKLKWGTQALWTAFTAK